MKTKNFKPDTAENAIAKKQLWTTIPIKAQEVISAGIGFNHIHLRQEFEAELATL